jgi:hypothetical protein
LNTSTGNVIPCNTCLGTLFSERVLEINETAKICVP